MISIVLLLLPFLNGDLATPLAGGITGLSIGLLMMPFVGVDRQGMENLYTMLPVRRTTIVAGHYLFGLMTVGLIDACSMLIIGLGWMARVNPIRDSQAFGWMLCFGTALMLFQIILSFPLMIGLGFKRAPLAAYFPLAILLIAVFLERSFQVDLDALKPWFGVIVAIFISAFIFSWWLSTMLYKKREF